MRLAVAKELLYRNLTATFIPSLGRAVCVRRARCRAWRWRMPVIV